ncbi:hypothetical protein L2E82_11194 [Cichorium intybus]|uniref:Uncharacterized protein n=1 Tax=Cichorium intybus TaxID=13427 RepID=A0ACB9GCM0_CICIN|nr:hypothetical protein L2E82_11194 [Cichorium intybus]
MFADTSTPLSTSQTIMYLIVACRIIASIGFYSGTVLVDTLMKKMKKETYNVETPNSDERERENGRDMEQEMKMALAEQAFAEDARQQTKKQIEMAEMEFENAKRIRQQAQVELERAKILREQATKKITSTMLEITCYSCRQRF